MFIESGIHRKPLVTGSFDSAGCPTIDIEISGPLGHKHQFTAMVDTDELVAGIPMPTAPPPAPETPNIPPAQN